MHVCVRTDSKRRDEFSSVDTEFYIKHNGKGGREGGGVATKLASMQKLQRHGGGGGGGAATK